MKRIVFGVILALLAANLALLITGRRVLIHERSVAPGESYVVAEHGDLGKNSQATLVCRYWTGRSVVTRVLWYSPNNIMGADQCPFMHAG